ncbi:glycosyltransferase [Candidatus Daviesbacteria bacterium]|nr:glycosyltransferase [Candidatus Daviesbacteria bacterium]
MERARGISLIIPARNEEARIVGCINSALQQTIPFNEIVVANNGSTDRTAEIARSLGCRVVDVHERGISPARNGGALEARYNILAFADADGILSPNWVEEALKSLKNPKIMAVSGYNHFTNPDPSKENHYNRYSRFAYGCVDLFQQAQLPFWVGNNLAVRAESFEKSGGFPSQVGEDVRLSFQLWFSGRPKSELNRNMRIDYSSRRFDQNGFFNTLFWDWLIGTITNRPQVKYSKVA